MRTLPRTVGAAIFETLQTWFNVRRQFRVIGHFAGTQTQVARLLPNIPSPNFPPVDGLKVVPANDKRIALYLINYGGNVWLSHRTQVSQADFLLKNVVAPGTPLIMSPPWAATNAIYCAGDAASDLYVAELVAAFRGDDIGEIT